MSFIMRNQQKSASQHIAINDKCHPTLMIFNKENSDQSSRVNDRNFASIEA